MARIYHLADPSEWAQAQQDGAYRRSTIGLGLDEVGYIHAADSHQWPGVRTRFYAETTTDLLLLEIDPDLLDVPMVREPGEPGSGELFPHILGPLPVGAVVRERVLPAPHWENLYAMDSRVSIEAPATRVFEVLLECGLGPQWVPRIDAMFVEHNGRAADRIVAEGDLVRFVSAGEEMVARVSNVTAPMILAIRSAFGRLDSEYTYVLSPDAARADSACTVRLVASIAIRGVPTAVNDAVRAQFADIDGVQLAALKTLVERG